jgi:hypothetical protein
MEVVVGNGLRLGGVERGGLIEVVRGVGRGGFFRVHRTEIQMEFCLGRSAGGMEEGRWKVG